jgi:hypothetical protein
MVCKIGEIGHAILRKNYLQNWGKSTCKKHLRVTLYPFTFMVKVLGAVYSCTAKLSFALSGIINLTPMG